MCLSGEVGADAIVEEMIRKGEDTSGSTGLRVPPRGREVVLPAPLVCGVINKLCRARSRPDVLSSIGVVDIVDLPRLLSCSVLDLGEVRSVWHVMAVPPPAFPTRREPLIQQFCWALRNVEQIALI